jgi:hypothetical protein
MNGQNNFILDPRGFDSFFSSRAIVIVLAIFSSK